MEPIKYSAPLKDAVTTSKPASTEESKPTLKVAYNPAKVDLGLGAALNKNKPAQGVVTKTKEKRNGEFNKEQIEELWMSFQAQIKQRASLRYVFTQVPSIDIEKKVVTITTTSNIIAEEMKEIMPKLTSYIHDGAGNDYIRIEVELKKEERGAMDLSPKGKARAMAEKNEKLRELCRRLHLDFT